MQYLVTAVAVILWLVWAAKTASAIDGLPPSCEAHGGCDVIIDIQPTEQHVYVRTPSWVLQFGREYVPFVTTDGRNIACVDLRRRLLPQYPVYAGRCALVTKGTIR